MRRIRALAAIVCASMVLTIGYATIPGSGAKLQDTQSGTFTVTVTVPETPSTAPVATTAPEQKKVKEKKSNSSKPSTSAVPTEISKEEVSPATSAPSSTTQKSPETEEKSSEPTP